MKMPGKHGMYVTAENRQPRFEFAVMGLVLRSWSYSLHRIVCRPVSTLFSSEANAIGKGEKSMRLLRYVLMWSCAAVAVCGCRCGNPESTADDIPAGQLPELRLNSAALVDVRSPEEYAAGHLKGAVNIPHDRIAEDIAASVPDKNTPVILYCRSGRRADTALKTMRAMGYEEVQTYGGLEDAQERLGLPVE